MARVEAVLGIVVLVVWIFSIVSCVLTPESQVRGIPKWAWVVLIVLLPLLGSVLWLAVGRTGGSPLPRLRPAAPTASAPRTYQAMTGDERIRRMEEDLARLERESDQGDGDSRVGRG